MRMSLTRFIPFIAAATLLSPSLAHAGVITATYINVQVSNNLDFTANAGNGGVVTNVANAGAAFSVPVGDYLRFGIAISVTGNPNPAAGDPWDLVNQANGHPAQPANLGVSVLGVTVHSTNPSGSILAGVIGLPRSGGGNKSKASVVQPVGPAGGTWGALEPGDFGPASLSVNSDGTGELGDDFPAGGGNVSIDPRVASGVASVQNLAGPGSNPFLTGIIYHAIAAGPVTLTPFFDPRAIGFWKVGDMGDPNDPDNHPVFYQSTPFAQSFSASLADTIVATGPLGGAGGITITPEPGCIGLLILALPVLIRRRQINGT